jgi:hypothetical protein
VNIPRLDGEFTVIFTPDEDWLKVGEKLFGRPARMGPLPRNTRSSQIRRHNRKLVEKHRKAHG